MSTARDRATQVVADTLIEHTWMRPPFGDCHCGHTMRLGDSFAAHQARHVVDAVWPFARVDLQVVLAHRTEQLDQATTALARLTDDRCADPCCRVVEEP